MIQWTTLTHMHIARGIDLSSYDVYVSYKQGSSWVAVNKVYRKANGS